MREVMFKEVSNGTFFRQFPLGPWHLKTDDRHALINIGDQSMEYRYDLNEMVIIDDLAAD